MSKLKPEVFCEMNGYPSKDWTIVSKSEAEIIQQNNVPEGSMYQNFHPVGVQNFGEGAWFVKKAIAEKYANSNPAQTEIEIPKATPKEAFDVPNVPSPPPGPKTEPVAPTLSGMVIPEPPKPQKQELETVFSIPDRPDVVKSKEDHFIDVEVYNQNVVDERLKFLEHRGIKIDDEKCAHLDFMQKIFSQQELHDLNMQEWDDLVKTVVENTDVKDDFLEEINKPVKQKEIPETVQKLDEAIPAEDPDEEIVVEDISEKEQKTEQKVSTGLANRIKRIENNGYLKQKNGTYCKTTESVTTVITEEDLLLVPAKFNKLFERKEKMHKALETEVKDAKIVVEMISDEANEISNEDLEAAAEKLDQIKEKAKSSNQQKSTTKTVEINKEKREARKEKEHVRVSRPASKNKDIAFLNTKEIGDNDTAYFLRTLTQIETFAKEYRRLIILESNIKEVLEKNKDNGDERTDGQVLDEIYKLLE